MEGLGEKINWVFHIYNTGSSNLKELHEDAAGVGLLRSVDVFTV